MANEIERKFILSKENFEKLVSYSVLSKIKIKQYYIKIEKDYELRARLENNSNCIVTEKIGSGLVRIEVEKDVNDREYYFSQYYKKIGNEIIKTRYKCFINSNIIYTVNNKSNNLKPLYLDKVICEIDQYYGKLEGLYIAEIEFNSVEQASKFIPPALFGEEVTNNENYKNKSLAIKGLTK